MGRRASISSVCRVAQAVRLAEQFREDETETVFPEGIPGDEQAFFRVVKGQCFHVMAGNGQQIPAQSAHDHLITGMDQVIVLETGRLLAER